MTLASHTDSTPAPSGPSLLGVHGDPSSLLRRRTSLYAVFLALAILSTACSEETRPTETAWGIRPTGTASLVPSELSGVVLRVYDGDTLTLTNGAKIRLLGIDAPERSNPTECWWRESRDALMQLSQGGPVEIEIGPEPLDRYGRTLAFLWRSGILLNLEMVTQGHAPIYRDRFRAPRYFGDFDTAERGAIAARRGLWGACP